MNDYAKTDSTYGRWSTNFRDICVSIPYYLIEAARTLFKLVPHIRQWIQNQESAGTLTGKVCSCIKAIIRPVWKGFRWIGRSVKNFIKTRGKAFVESRKRNSWKARLILSFIWWIGNYFIWAKNRFAESIKSYITIKAIKIVNELGKLNAHRPAVRSLWGNNEDKINTFSAWRTLTDRSFNARSRPPSDNAKNENRVDKLMVNLFIRNRGDTAIPAERTSILFPFFARWFTDSFMRIDGKDRRKNTSNHQIDLCQIYGLTEEETSALRLKRDGLLRSRLFEDKKLIWNADDCKYKDQPNPQQYHNKNNPGIKQPKYNEYLPKLFHPISESSDYSDDSDNSGESDKLNESKYKIHGFVVYKRYRKLIDKHMTINGVKELNNYLKKLFEFAKKRDDFKIEQAIPDMYATGLERGNASAGYTMFSTLFLRQHNRLCTLLKDHSIVTGLNGEDRDELLFQTARKINTIILLKLVVVCYIKHISGRKVAAGFYPGRLSHHKLWNIGRVDQQWFKENWVSLEFNLLYRWHSLVPEHFWLKGKRKDFWDLFHNNQLLENESLENMFCAASSQFATKLALKNTPHYLYEAEKASLEMAKQFRLGSYNDYRETFGLKRVDKLTEIYDREACEHIVRAYNQLPDDSDITDVQIDHFNVDRLDFYVGLFGEQEHEGKIFGELMFKMVASDAFTHLYKNPLLSRELYNERELTDIGLKEIDDINTFEDLLLRNSTQARVSATFDI